jgi:hypothetical protein
MPKSEGLRRLRATSGKIKILLENDRLFEASVVFFA